MKFSLGRNHIQRYARESPFSRISKVFIQLTLSNIFLIHKKSRSETLYCTPKFRRITPTPKPRIENPYRTILLPFPSIFFGTVIRVMMKRSNAQVRDEP